MRLFPHFSVVGFSNSYLLGPSSGEDAVLIDPGTFDTHLLQLIEGNGLYIRSILVTHAHTAHIDGIRTLLKVYESSIYSYRSSVAGHPATAVRNGDVISLGELVFRVYETPGHSSDSVVFHMDRYLFTGDTLAAGSIGTTNDGYARGLELASIRKKILTLDDSVLIFPGHGPPSRVGIERQHNPYIDDKL